LAAISKSVLPSAAKRTILTLDLARWKGTRSGPLLQGFRLRPIDDNRRGNAHRTPPQFSRLREIAAHLLQRERGDHTLEPNALVNELCIRVFGNQKINYNDRAHFFAVAAQMMRRILIDHARAGLAEKRGGEQQRVSLSGVGGWTPVPLNEDMLALDAALSRPAALDPRAAQVVELRFFGGLEEDQVGELLGVSPITVKRDWKAAPGVVGRPTQPR
jgi:RNA polymerase sigma factor (TIGR02999 family)